MLRLLLVLCVFAWPALCFNALGHQLVGSVAQRLLSPKARQGLTQIVRPSPLDLAAIAPWADRIKHTRAYYWTASLHYINPVQDFPPGACAADFSNVRTPDSTLLTAIKNFTERLGDETLARWPREEALRFLVHFIGDSEQPLHLTGRARGGNDIHLRFNGRNTSLHSVWDGSLISKLQRTLTPTRIHYDDFLEYLFEELETRYLNSTARWLGCPYPDLLQNQIVLHDPSAPFKAQEGCIENWMEETHQLNCGGVWSFDTSSVSREPVVIERDLVTEYWAGVYGVDLARVEMYGEYFDVDLSEGEYWDWVVRENVIQRMLIRGGVRLAGVLNRIFEK